MKSNIERQQHSHRRFYLYCQGLSQLWRWDFYSIYIKKIIGQVFSTILFSIVMRRKLIVLLLQLVEYKFLTEEFLLNKVCMLPKILLVMLDF